MSTRSLTNRFPSRNLPPAASRQSPVNSYIECSGTALVELQDGRRARIFVKNLDGDFQLTGPIESAPKKGNEIVNPAVWGNYAQWPARLPPAMVTFGGQWFMDEVRMFSPQGLSSDCLKISARRDGRWRKEENHTEPLPKAPAGGAD